jgi:Ion channel
VISISLIAFVLVAVTVAVHAAGLAVLLSGWTRVAYHSADPLLAHPSVADPRDLVADPDPPGRDFGLGIVLFLEGLPADAKSAFYFSGVTYTTIGYGDLVLSEPWRILGPIEGLTGILMCGLSTAFFFAMISRILLSRSAAKQK